MEHANKYIKKKKLRDTFTFRCGQHAALKHQ